MTPFSGLTAADAAARRTPFRIAVTAVQETRTELVLQSLRNDPLAVDQTPQPTGR